MGELSRRLWRRVSFGIKKPQRRTSGHKSASHCGESREEISMNNPTILRTRHKFGDYLSQPDIAKFELPKKMSRPWIVNNAYEEEKLKTLIVTETPVEASEVMLQIKEENIFQSTQPSPFSCSSTCSSVSPPASDDGFVDGSDESADETDSLAEMMEDKLDLSLEDKMDLSLEEKLDLSLEESDNEIDFEILDEDLERVVRSIIEEDD